MKTRSILFIIIAILIVVGVGFRVIDNGDISQEATKDVSTAEAIDVLLTTNQQQYDRDELIEVTIRNDLDAPIAIVNKAARGILEIERKVGNQWQQIVSQPIPLGPPTAVEIIESRTTTTATYSTKNLSPGTYRVSIRFSQGNRFQSERSFVSYSPPVSVDDAVEESKQNISEDDQGNIPENYDQYIDKSCINDDECAGFPCVSGSCFVRQCKTDSDCPNLLCSEYLSPTPHGYCTNTDVK